MFFRASTRDLAQGLGLTGWARNEPDGSVTVQAQGRAEDVDALLEAVRAGPGHAEVTSLDVADLPTIADEQGFGIR